MAVFTGKFIQKNGHIVPIFNFIGTLPSSLPIDLGAASLNLSSTFSPLGSLSLGGQSALTTDFTLASVLSTSGDVESSSLESLFWREQNDPSGTVVLDVNLLHPLIQLPIYIGGNTFIDYETNVSQSGPEEVTLRPGPAEAGSGVTLFIELPSQTGIYSFTHSIKTCELTITQDPDDELTWTVSLDQSVNVNRVRRNKPLTDASFARGFILPISTGITQLCGPTVGLHTNASGTWADLPDQVCTMIFDDYEGSRCVVRVWEDYQNQYFVSPSGDDSNDGTTESTPLRTLGHAFNIITSGNTDADIYVAGGEYIEPDGGAHLNGHMSIFGGFDPSGWRRDPAITASLLLPSGFNEFWLDQMPARFKNLRRRNKTNFETEIKRIWNTTGYTIKFGDNSGSTSGPLSILGSVDTFVDGITVYGSDNHTLDEPNHLIQYGFRTVRNCIVFTGAVGGHAYSPFSVMNGFTENNLGWCDPQTGGDRPQLQIEGGVFRSNLIIYPIGGDYNRMFLMWRDGAVMENNQLHAYTANSFTRLTAIAAVPGSLDKFTNTAHAWLVRNNLIYNAEHIGYHDAGIPYEYYDEQSGVIAAKGIAYRDNTSYTLESGFRDWMHMGRVISITGNTFNIPIANSGAVLPSGAFPSTSGNALISVSGGYVDIQNNTVTDWDGVSYAPSLIDASALVTTIQNYGKIAIIPPSGATNLAAEVSGSDVTLTWDASLGPDVSGYIIRYGNQPDSWRNPVFAGNNTEYTVSGLSPGTYYFTVAAHKPAYVESRILSNEASVTV